MNGIFAGASIYKTKGVDVACRISNTFDREVMISLSKFMRLDYGETSYEDILINETLCCIVIELLLRMKLYRGKSGL